MWTWNMGELDAPAQTIIDNVLWWTRILKTAHVTAWSG